MYFPRCVVLDVAGIDLPHGAHIENAIDPPDGVEIYLGKGFGLELGEVGADDPCIRVVLCRPFLLRCLLTRLGDREDVLGAESADLVVDVVGDARADRAGDGQRERADEDGEHRQVVRVLLRRVLPTAVVSMSVIFMRMLRSVRGLLLGHR